MENFIVTATCLLIGMIIRKAPDFPKETGNILNLFVIYISLPALILLKIPELPFSKNIFIPALMPWCILVFSVIIILLLIQGFQMEQINYWMPASFDPSWQYIFFRCAYGKSFFW